MPSPSNYVLFTAADTAGMYTKTLEDFENHLVNNVLFEDKLLIQDGYLVDSTFLLKHLERTNRGGSLFEKAASNGLVIPAYRQRGTRSLRDALAIMEKDYGSNVHLEIGKFDPVLAGRLFECVDQGNQAFYWPAMEGTHLGEEFGKLVRQELQKNDHMEAVLTAGNKPHLEELWAKTRLWRTDLIDQAEERTREKNQRGIQRSEIFLLLHSQYKISNITELPEGHPDKWAATAFLRWVTQCHQLNMSRIFGSSVHLLEYEAAADFVPDNVLRSPDPYPVMDMEPIVCEVDLPKPGLLLGYFKKKLDSLLDIRRDLGQAYLEALRTWRTTPTWRNKSEVRQGLVKYCEKICKYYLENTEPQKWLIQIRNGLGQPIGMAAALFHGIAAIAFKEGARTGVKMLSNSYHLNTTLNPSIRKTDVHIYHPDDPEIGRPRAGAL